jgi:hypothetical protein
MPIIIFSRSNPILLPLSKVTQLTTGKNRLFRLFQVVVIAVAVTYLYDKLADDFSFSKLGFDGNITLLIAAFVLMPLNWLLEAFKWQVLIRKVKPVNLASAFRTVWIGAFYGLFTPNRAGDLAGRLHFAQKGSNTRVSFAFINGSVAQTLTTLLAGSIALALVPEYLTQGDAQWWKLLVILRWPIWMLTIIVLLLYLEPGWLTLLKGSFKAEGFIGKRLSGLEAYPRNTNYLILLISILRYAVFSTQFYLLLVLYGWAGFTPEAYFRIAILYVASTLIPTVALAELGLRESLALLLFPIALLSPSAAFAATFILWIINLLLPAIFGGYFFAKLRNFRNA